jgi:transcriptional regulator with XRE-family HTH domain
MRVPRRPESEPTAFSKAATAAVRRLKADKRISNADISAATGMSTNYIAERLRDEKSFTLNDIELVADFFGIDATDFLIDARAASRSNVTELRPRNDSGYVDDALKEQGYETAAGSDETQADEFE